MAILNNAMGNIAATAGNTAAAAQEAMFATASLPEWVQILFALVGVGSVVSIASLLADFRLRFRQPGSRDKEFAQSLVKGAKKQTDTIKREIIPLLRAASIASAEAVAHTRQLRWRLREACALVLHIRSYQMADWPSFALSDAFAEWAAVIDATDAVLKDLLDEVRTAVETGRWPGLREQYHREQWFVLRDFERLPGLLAEIEKQAKPFIKKSKSRHDGDEDHPETHDDHH